MDSNIAENQLVTDKPKSSDKKKFYILVGIFSFVLLVAIILGSVFLGIYLRNKKNFKNEPETYVNQPAKVVEHLDKVNHQEVNLNQLEKKTRPNYEPSDKKNTYVDTLKREGSDKNDVSQEVVPNPPGVDHHENVVHKPVINSPKTDEQKHLNVDRFKKPNIENKTVVEDPKPLVVVPGPNKVVDHVVKKTDNPGEVITNPGNEHKKTDGVHRYETPEKVVEVPGDNVEKEKNHVGKNESHEKIKNEKQTDIVENPKKEDVEEHKKKFEELMEEHKRKMKEEQDFRNEMDILFKIRQEKAMEEARRIKELREGKNQKPVKVPENFVPKGTDKDTIFKKLEEFAPKVKLTVIKGTFEMCLIGKCQKLKSDFVYEWELQLIAELVHETKRDVDLDKEYKTINEFREFNKKYGRYISTKKIFKENYDNYRKNVAKIEKHNKDPNRLYNMEINELADLSSDLSLLSTSQVEMKRERLSGASKNKRNLRNQEIHIDWRTKGVVQPVVHQGSCGSCWAIAATDVFNSYSAIKNKDKTKYSYQQLVDCVSPKYNCDKGGNQVKGLEYIRDNKLCKDDEYKYKGVKNQCTAYRCEKDSGVKEIKNLKDKDAMEFLKNNGPFVTLFYASNDFFLYGDGIFNGSCESKEAHSVVVVGHGLDTEKNKKYWIAKNSWGENWGEEGYFRILDESSGDSDPKSQFCDFLKYSYGIL